MDIHSINALKGKIEEINKFIQKTNNQEELTLLNGAKEMFTQAVSEWEEFNEREQYGMRKDVIKQLILKLIQTNDLKIDISNDITNWGDVVAIASLNLFSEELLNKSETVYQISDDEN